MYGINFRDALNALTVSIIAVAAAVLLFYLAQLIIYSVLVFKCAKFKRETVKENFRGIKGLSVCAETFVFIQFIIVVFGVLDIPGIINLWGSGELTAADILSWLFPISLFIYGIYAWRCYLRAKRIYSHLFSGIDIGRRKNKYADDDALLFGDSKMIDLNAKKTEEDKESMDDAGNRRYIQSEDIDLRALKPLSSGELIPCPYCESLNAHKSRICVFCGADLPYTENREVAPISPEDVNVVDGSDSNNGGK